MRLKGSCHCQAVRFEVDAYAPSPYLRCYCSICRKVAGAGGYAINLGAHSHSLEVSGDEHIRVYDAKLRQPGTAEGAGRRFCVHCASALWHYDIRYPELIHPFASCIDVDLPPPPTTTHILLNSRANWVRLDSTGDDECLDAGPNQSLAQWHARARAAGHLPPE